MHANHSDELLRLTARLYYIDGLGQPEVAKFVKVSQAKVSRLLALAREKGIVRISVAEYEPRDKLMEQRLQKELRLNSVAVIKTLPGATAEEARLTVAHFGAAFVGSLIAPNEVVAISGGRTMKDLVQFLPEEHGRKATVIQAMGSVDSNVGAVDAMELGRSLARRWGGFFYTLNSPAFVPDKKTRDAFLGLQQIQTVWARLKTAKAALVGIGTLSNSIFVERAVLSTADLEKLSQDGAVGEICGRFFDRNGRECDSRWRDRVLSIDLERLREIPQVIGVVAGGNRSAAIAAAIRGRLLKSLVIDNEGAASLLEYSKSKKSAKGKSTPRISKS